MPIRRRWRAPSWTMALTATLLVLATAAPGRASSQLIVISNDPYRTDNAQHKSEVEPDSFMYGSTIVATFQVGRIYNGGATNIGWATSTDGGDTWTRGFLPGITPIAGGTIDRGSDPAVAYDAQHHVWLISVLGIHLHSPNDVVVSRSYDGLNWTPPVTVFAGSSRPNTDLDKEWVSCDNSLASPFYGHCYIEFDNFRRGDLVFFTTSTDGGLTWRSARATAAPHARGLGAEPVVQPNGRVIAPFLGESPGGLAYQSVISDDGGRSWSSPHDIASFDQYFEPANIRNLALPSVSIDAAGTVYVVWHDCRFEAHCSANDIVMSTSSDGAHWSPVQWIPIDHIGSGVDHFTPGIGAKTTTAGEGAHLAITYYYVTQAGCHPATCLLNVGFLSSRDGGHHWSPPHHLAGPMNLGWLPITSSGYMYGDYIATEVAGDDVAWPVFAVAHPPGQVRIPHTNTLRVPMYTSPRPVTGGTRATRTAGAHVTRSSPPAGFTTAN